MEYHPSHYKQENLKELIDSVLNDWRDYLRSDGEILLGRLLAEVLVKNNILVHENQQLTQGYLDLVKWKDEMQMTFLNIASEQKRINQLYSNKINKIKKKFP